MRGLNSINLESSSLQVQASCMLALKWLDSKLNIHKASGACTSLALINSCTTCSSIPTGAYCPFATRFERRQLAASFRQDASAFAGRYCQNSAIDWLSLGLCFVSSAKANWCRLLRFVCRCLEQAGAMGHLEKVLRVELASFGLHGNQPEKARSMLVVQA